MARDAARKPKADQAQLDLPLGDAPSKKGDATPRAKKKTTKTKGEPTTDKPKRQSKTKAASRTKRAEVDNSIAESMSRGQRDISIAEFFAKNRHLLGFDNRRKALLTSVKEAVDNSLDACEEARILPDIEVQIYPV